MLMKYLELQILLSAVFVDSIWFELNDDVTPKAEVCNTTMF